MRFANLVVLLGLSLHFLSIHAALWTEDALAELHKKFVSPERFEKLRGSSTSTTTWMEDGHHHHGRRRVQMRDDEHATIMNLRNNCGMIQREMQEIDNGLLINTTSSDPNVAGYIQDHVNDMMNLAGRRFRHGDPLFRALFDRHDEIRMTVKEISNTNNGQPVGVSVEHTGTTKCAELLVKDHAETVNRFIGTCRLRPDFYWNKPDECN